MLFNNHLKIIFTIRVPNHSSSCIHYPLDSIIGAFRTQQHLHHRKRQLTRKEQNWFEFHQNWHGISVELRSLPSHEGYFFFQEPRRPQGWLHFEVSLESSQFASRKGDESWRVIQLAGFWCFNESNFPWLGTTAMDGWWVANSCWCELINRFRWKISSTWNGKYILTHKYN